MAKLFSTLDVGFKYIFKFARMLSFTSAAVTRVKSVYFCRYSCVSDNIIK